MTKIITILFIVTSHAVMGATEKPTGVWFEELATPYYAFKDAGYDVEIVTIKGGAVPIDPRSQQPVGENPPSVERFLQDEQAMNLIRETRAVTDVDGSGYDAVFLPGGHGTMWDLPENAELSAVISTIYQDGGVVAAVCHGPAGLIGPVDSDGNPLVQGKKVAAFTNSEEDAVGLTDAVPFLLETKLRELGADVQTAPDFQPFAVADGRLVTGQNPASSKKVAELVKERLESSDE